MSQNGGNMFPAKAEKPEVLYEVKAQRGGFDKPDTLRCKGWKQETILRMLENNMENAEIPEMLVIYGGNGKCARNWESYYAIIESLKNLENDEGFCKNGDGDGQASGGIARYGLLAGRNDH